jgi:hypothetical protein
MPVGKAPEVSRSPENIRPRAGVARAVEHEANESAEFYPCFETLKVMNRLMAGFFNVEIYTAVQEGKTTAVPGR